MHKSTLKALLGSIDKWECICMGMSNDFGGNNCPLCALNDKNKGNNSECIGCIVKKKTGHSQCRGTSYRKFVNESNIKWDSTTKQFSSYECSVNSAEYAVEMLEFLIDLLPERDKKLYNKEFDELEVNS